MTVYCHVLESHFIILISKPPNLLIYLIYLLKQLFHQEHSASIPSCCHKQVILPLLYLFRSPCLPPITLSSVIHHTPFSLSVLCIGFPPQNQLLSLLHFQSSTPPSFPHTISELLSSLLSASISSGRGVLHPGSLFRLITCLVNTFIDSTVSDA